MHFEGAEIGDLAADPSQLLEERCRVAADVRHTTGRPAAEQVRQIDALTAHLRHLDVGDAVDEGLLDRPGEVGFDVRTMWTDRPPSAISPVVRMVCRRNSGFSVMSYKKTISKRADSTVLVRSTEASSTSTSVPPSSGRASSAGRSSGAVVVGDDPAPSTGAAPVSTDRAFSPPPQAACRPAE